MNQLNQPRQVFLPDPLPVSGPPEAHNFGQAGNSGTIYGTQQYAVWAPGDTGERQVLDVRKCDSLWRVSVFGRVTLSVDYGTQATRKIALLQAPMVMCFPGQVTIKAVPIDEEGADCMVTLTQTTAWERAIARQFVTAPAGAVNLDRDAVDYFALTASTLTISGAAVVVPALASVPLVSGSVLNTGSGFQEFEA